MPANAEQWRLTSIMMRFSRTYDATQPIPRQNYKNAEFYEQAMLLLQLVWQLVVCRRSKQRTSPTVR